MPEKDDMSCPKRAIATQPAIRKIDGGSEDMDEPQQHGMRISRGETIADWDRAFAHVVAELESRESHRAAQEPSEVLRCVSSGYLDGGCSCPASVPADVAAAAWHGELARGEERDDRFFRFTWQGETWRGYGLRDGCIRGVYCPAHSAERDRRALAAGS